jgi:hypothetical protein
VYLPDLTTSASRAAIDSVDLAALDFLVGAIASVGRWCRLRIGDGLLLLHKLNKFKKLM